VVVGAANLSRSLVAGRGLFKLTGEDAQGPSASADRFFTALFFPKPLLFSTALWRQQRV